MINQFKDNPKLWEDIYQDQDTRRLGEFGFPVLSSTKIILGEKPSELLDLHEKIDAFWNEYAAGRKGARNGKMYGMSGWNNFDYEGATLVARVYETNFATLLLKQDARGMLTRQEQEFLDNNVMFLGSSGFVRYNNSYLAGKVAKMNIKQDLWETVPQGSVSYGFHEHTDPFLKTLGKETIEETGLDLSADFDLVLPFGINLGPKVGNCTVIYQMQLKPSSAGKIKCSPEHLELRWATRKEILDPVQRYAWNPVTPLLFEKIAGGK